MTEDNCEAGKSRSSFLPVLLIGLSAVYLYAGQLKTMSEERTSLVTAVQQQEDAVKQALQTQDRLLRIAKELRQLAQEGDPDAKALVAKYNINIQGEATPQK